MTMNVVMGKEEINDLMNLSRKLRAEGREEEATKVAMKIPLAPHLAMALKEVYGAEYVRNAGFNLADAEVKYGTNWLDK